MGVVAILATYKEPGFIGLCLHCLHSQGLDSYSIGSCSASPTFKWAPAGRGSRAAVDEARNQSTAHCDLSEYALFAQPI